MTNIVLNIDCNKGMKSYRDGYFDLAIVDIPYGIDVANMAFIKERGTKVKQRNGNKISAFSNKKTYSTKDWDKSPPDQQYFDELRRVSKNQIIFGIEYVDWSGVGSGRIKWNKLIPEGMSFSKYEVAYCSMIDHETEITLLWAGMQQAKSLTEPTVQQGNKKLNEKRIHPCHKPILLYDKLFLDYGFRGMKVIDTHIGGGSIRISADKFGVSEFVGFEIDQEYFNDQESRFNSYKSQLSFLNQIAA